MAQAKGATIAAVVVAGAATATVGATTPEVQDAVREVAANLGVTLENADRSRVRGCDDEGGQPAVVAQRNAADKLLRDMYQDHQKALQELRKDAPKDAENKGVNDVIKNADDGLRDTLNVALNKVAGLTLGREGQLRKAEAPASPVLTPASASPALTTSASPSPKASCTPKASASPAAVAAPGSPSPKPAGSGKPEEQGRVAVANRTTLDPQIASIVSDAKSRMDDIVKNAKADLAKVPTAEHGKSGDNPGNKPEDKGKSDDKGKPAENPANRATGRPSPTR